MRSYVCACLGAGGSRQVTVHKMLRGDVPRFAVLYLATHCGFAFGRRLLLRSAAGAAGDTSSADASGGGEELVHDMFRPFWVRHPANLTVVYK